MGKGKPNVRRKPEINNDTGIRQSRKATVDMSFEQDTDRGKLT